MSEEFTKIKKSLSKTEKLERELNLKQLQITRLLTITQSINDNVKAPALFKMYSAFIGWEMGVKKMALFYRKDESWVLASSHGVDEKLVNPQISSEFSKFDKTYQLTESKHPLLGQFDVVIPVKHKDTPIAYAFIGGLAEEEDFYNKVQFITTITNIIAVAIENKRMFKQQIEQERLRKEMQVAKKMQLQLVPSELHKCEKYELSSIYQPHNSVGGDYYDYIEFPGEKFVFCIGDITGKGAAAALLMANFQANFHTLIRKRDSLDQFVREINDALARATKYEKFITFFVAEFDRETMTLKYVNAGHNPPFLAMAGNIHRLDKGCPILGMLEELPNVEVGEVKIEQDAMILTFTDGLTDLQNNKGEFLSDELLEDFMRGNAVNSADDFNDLLQIYVDNFRGEQKFPDDLTVLTCKIRS